MRNIGRTKVDEFKRIGFKHETKEFLVRLSVQDYGFAIEAIVQQDFIWWQVTEARVSQDETIVNIANVANGKMVILKDGFEIGCPDLFTDGYNDKAQGR